MIISDLPTGYIHVRGDGPCEFAQWPSERRPCDGDFFPEASEKFRREVYKRFGRTDAPPGR